MFSTLSLVGVAFSITSVSANSLADRHGGALETMLAQALVENDPERKYETVTKVVDCFRSVRLGIASVSKKRIALLSGVLISTSDLYPVRLQMASLFDDGWSSDASSALPALHLLLEDVKEKLRTDPPLIGMTGIPVDGYVQTIIDSIYMSFALPPNALRRR